MEKYSHNSVAVLLNSFCSILVKIAEATQFHLSSFTLDIFAGGS